MSSDCMLCPDMAAEMERLKRWVTDLQAGMSVNCVYCGHRYGPSEKWSSLSRTTPVSMADVLRVHVESCLKHPMAKLKVELREANEKWAVTIADRDAILVERDCLLTVLSNTPENVDAVAQIIGGPKSTSRRDARAILAALRTSLEAMNALKRKK